MLRKLLLSAIVAGLMMACLPGAASAFTYGGEAWCCDTVYYLINATEPSLSCGGSFGWAFRARVMVAGATWNNLGTTFQLINTGTTSLNCIGPGDHGNCYGPHDGQNTVSMATGCNWSDNNVIAYSTWWYWTSGDSAGCISEGDVCFNDEVAWYNNSDDCSGNCYDLISVAEHELGHWISSDHENDNAVLGYKPIMYYQFNYCEQRRTVTADDSALVHWAYGLNDVISLPSRASVWHDHPPYEAPPPHEECFPLGCEHLQWDPCLLVCPASDVTYTVTVTVGGQPVCATDVLSLILPGCPVDTCPGEEPDWPLVYADSCNPATGVHYFTVDAKLLECVDYDCWGYVNLSTMSCGPIPARFLDNDGDGCVTQSDYVGGRICEDLNCNFASDNGDQTIWAAHLDHCCGSACCLHRGDLDHSDGGTPIDIADLVYLVDYMFNGGPAPLCWDEGDVDGSGTPPIDISDLVYLVDYMFTGGPPPPDCR